MRYLLLYLGVCSCANSATDRPPVSTTPPVRATSYQQSHEEAERQQREAEDRARAEHPARETHDVTVQSATPHESPRANVDPTECGSEWERKMVWVNQHCQRQRTDVTVADTSRAVVNEDGRLANDTYTQSETSVTCPADAPDEMKRFAKAHRHCKPKR